MTTIVRGIRHNDIFRYPPPRVTRATAARRPVKDAVTSIVQTLQRLGDKMDAVSVKQADAEAKLDRIGPVVAAAAEERAMRDAMAAQNARRDERLQAIRDGKPIRPETTAEMAALHARHYGRAR